MKKILNKFACFFALLFFSGLAVASEPIKSEESQKTKAIPAIVSLLMEEISTPDAIFSFPDTGQNKCYSNSGIIDCPTDPGAPFYGQDAQYPRITRSYTKLGQEGAELENDAAHADNGGEWVMTRDDVTGLVWEIKTSDNKNVEYTWSEAGNFIDQLNNNGGGFGGFTDWRLPSRAELSSLSDRSKHEPAIDPNWFPDTMSWRYWSDTTVAQYTSRAWRVNAAIGFVYHESKTNNSYHVRAVRGPVIDHNMVDNNDGTVTDKTNGLIWKKCSYGQQWDGNSQSCTGTAELLTWENALAKAAQESDWRLPNINELQSLVDDSVYSPAIYEPFRPHSPPVLSPGPDHADTLPYWSSTTDVRFPAYDRAWLVNFVDGSNNYDGYRGDQGVKTLEFYVRLVRTVK